MSITETTEKNNRHSINLLRKGIFRLMRNYELYLFLLPAIVYFIVFHYGPMYGLQIAFKMYNPRVGFADSPFVGLVHFRRFIESYHFARLIKNTLGISIYSLVVNFPAPIILALIINEIRSNRYKRIVQTVTYAPHFISTVVIVAMLMLFLNTRYGLVNQILKLMSMSSVEFMASASLFKTIYVMSGVWQTVGWGSIIYLAALSAVDPELHESAMIDGANRVHRIWYINIPSIMPTVVILLILNLGRVMSVGFEKVFLMQNPMNITSSEIIATYVYKVGMLQAQFSFSTAVGLFNSVLNLIMLISANYFARKIGETSLF